MIYIYTHINTSSYASTPQSFQSEGMNEWYLSKKLRDICSSRLIRSANYAKVTRETERERGREGKGTWSGDEEEDVRVETDLRREVLLREDTPFAMTAWRRNDGYEGQEEEEESRSSHRDAAHSLSRRVFFLFSSSVVIRFYWLVRFNWSDWSQRSHFTGSVEEMCVATCIIPYIYSN